jgi:hypothetical protein
MTTPNEGVRSLRVHPDVLAVIVLIALWLLFFWRLFTPIEVDQASLKSGDFSGQFVTFAAYQYNRWTQGEVPLWNPYNNGGLPFIADTQAAVFYPPRLLTIALAYAGGGFSYRALEWEMTAHVLAYTLMMYALARRLTLRQQGTHLAGITAAIIGGYGGFMAGYPPLQLAVLEAAIWLPLALLGIHEAARSMKPQAHWLLLTGIALGLSWLAGHPQSSFLMTWLLLAYWGYRVYQQRWRWTSFISGAALFGGVSFGLAAVQLLPGVEYLARTTRAGFGFDAKGNGFPLQDLFQFIVPNVVSVFSPLYVGVAGLALAAVALFRRAAGAWFWLVAAGVALLWSLGANSVLYPLLYNTLPGAYFFRGQERGALVVANALAILAALGIAQLAAWRAGADDATLKRLRQWITRAAIVIGAIAVVAIVAWLGNRSGYEAYIPYFVLSALVIALVAVLLPHAARGQRLAAFAIVGLIVFELFTVNMDADAVYDPVPPAEQISFAPPSLIAQALADNDMPFRVDGFRGLTANYGSLYGLADIRGISPLWLGSAYTIIEGDIPDERAWELFAVRYVFTDWNELPVPSEIIGRGADFYGEINLHRLANPRPFALLMSNYEIVADDAAAVARLADPAFDPRQTLLLNTSPPIEPSAAANATVEIIDYAPEAFTIQIESDAAALLSVAQVDYPDWYAQIDGTDTPILRAYGALSAVVIPQGTHTVQFVYNPLSYRVGAIISLITCIALVISQFLRSRKTS